MKRSSFKRAKKGARRSAGFKKSNKYWLKPAASTPNSEASPSSVTSNSVPSGLPSRTLLRAALYIRENYKSAISDAPAEQLGETFVTRGDVMCWHPKERRDAIMVEENCAFISAEENEKFTRERKYRAMLYLVATYGFEPIDAWLTRIEWKETARQIIRRVRPDLFNTPRHLREGLQITE